MSGDEVFVTLASVVVGPLLWTFWLFRMSRLQALPGRRRSSTGVIALGLVASAAVMIFILTTAASFDVVSAPVYQFMYLVLGLAWLRGCAALFAFAGLSPRDDVIERRNRAAAIAMAGALLGVAFCYTGGNIGDGPGWWVVVFGAGLATGTLLVTWILLTRMTTIADAVTIDRD